MSSNAVRRAIVAARAALESGAFDRVDALLRPLISGKRPEAEASFLLAASAERQRRTDEAAALAEKSLAAHRHPAAVLLLARCRRAAGRTDECVALCDEVAAPGPLREQARLVKAAALEEAGRYGDAQSIIGPMIESEESGGGPAPAPAVDVWSRLQIHAKDYAGAVASCDRLLGQAGIPEDARRATLYTKAKAHDRAGAYDAAIESAAEANRIGELPFDPSLYADQVTTLTEIWSAERMPRFPSSTEDSPMPVFIAGMPRSGTSLIDQIIDAHPKAAGVGELATIERFARELSAAYDPDRDPPACFGRYDAFRWTRVARDYVRDLRKRSPAGVERVVNKALGNNKLIGLIARLFPKTRIIHAVRDPRDVAVSCFMGGFNNRLHPWTTRLEWTACAWEQSRRMMDHWKATLDVPVLDVSYEHLVARPETQFRRITEFLGLEWDDRCLSFHTSRRTVRTLSYDQVNRPLYTSSSGRHRHYARWVDAVPWPEHPRATDQFG